MLELVSSQQQVQFGLDKRDKLPQYCLDCEVRFACCAAAVRRTASSRRRRATRD